jgi:hypothetical protein
VELRGQLSNPSIKHGVDLVEALLSRSEPCGGADHPALRTLRQVVIRDKVDMDELAWQFVHGMRIKDLAASYAISESSVKRLLRSRAAR